MTRRRAAALILLGACVLGAVLLALLRPAARPTENAVPLGGTPASGSAARGGTRARAHPPNMLDPTDGTTSTAAVVNVSVKLEVEGRGSTEFAVYAQQNSTTQRVALLRSGEVARVQLEPGQVAWTALESQDPANAVSEYERIHLTTAAREGMEVLLSVRRGTTTLDLQVLDTTHTPVAGIMVNLSGRAPGLARTTDATGCVSWQGIEDISTLSDPIEVLSLPPGWVRRAGPTVEWSPGAAGATGRVGTATMLVARPRASVRARIADYGALSALSVQRGDGRWVPAPPDGFAGEIEDEFGRSVTGDVRRGADYVLSRQGLAPGRYRLAYLTGSGTEVRSAEFEVKDDEAAFVSDFSATPVRSIAGRIEGPGRGTLTRLLVATEFDRSRTPDVLLPAPALDIPVGSQGSFSIPLLPGLRTLSFIPQDVRIGMATIAPLRHDASNHGDLVVETVHPARLRGRVVDVSDKPVAGARIWVRSLPADRARWRSVHPRYWARPFGPYTADADGVFETGPELPGTWQVQVVGQGTAAADVRWDTQGITEVPVADGSATECRVVVR